MLLGTFLGLLLLLVNAVDVLIAADEQTIPLVSECPVGESTIYLLRQPEKSLLALDVQSFRTVNSEFLECTEHCTTSQECVGVFYDGSDGARDGSGPCQLLQRKVDNDAKRSRGQRRPAEDGIKNGSLAVDGQQQQVQQWIVTKSCVKSKTVCSSPFHFDVREQKILVGFAHRALQDVSLRECLSACLNAFDQLDFECKSALYYPDPDPRQSECVLNTENGLDRPDLRLVELPSDDTVFYLGNSCAGTYTRSEQFGDKQEDKTEQQFGDTGAEESELDNNLKSEQLEPDNNLN